jgi:hypothetical protein
MAHAVQPNHKPHDQLRMEAPSQKTHSDKYVSAFTTGSATVDMTFRNPILPKSADHFKVGIDELTVNLGNLSMLEYGTNDVLFRVLRRGNNLGEVAADFQMIDGPVGSENQWRDAFEFKIDRAYLTILEILERCTEVATAVGSYMRDVGLVQPVGGDPALYTLVLLPNAGNFEHFRISITANGQLKFSGNRIFWANFTIEVPLEKYRVIFFKDIDKRYISLHPGTGNEIAEPYAVNFLGLLTAAVLAPVWNGNYGNPNIVTALEYVGSGNLLNTLDRRVTLEVGCSLPLKNSPLVDHGEEAPDFVIGRFMFHQPYSMNNSAQGIVTANPIPEITVPHLGTLTVQGPRDRVVYHHLQPQQKIQVLRLKLWARVRTFSSTTKKWGMRTIVCPVDDMDYWHLRLHFIEK